MPAYVVFTDLTLQAIAEVQARRRPRRCCRINGIGEAKLTKYGDDVLALVGRTPRNGHTGVARPGHRMMLGKVFREIPRK